SSQSIRLLGRPHGRCVPRATDVQRCWPPRLDGLSLPGERNDVRRLGTYGVEQLHERATVGCRHVCGFNYLPGERDDRKRASREWCDRVLDPGSERDASSVLDHQHFFERVGGELDKSVWIRPVWNRLDVRSIPLRRLRKREADGLDELLVRCPESPHAMDGRDGRGRDALDVHEL